MSVLPQKQVLQYINEARQNPKKFSEYVKKQIDNFIDNQRLPLKPNCYYATNEGKKAWIQAYQFLKNHDPIYPYKFNQGLSLACMDHAYDMQSHVFMGHNSSDGTSFGKRIQRRCGKAYGSAGQNIGTDFNINGRNHSLQTVLGLIIDDGIPNRGHRKSIFSTDFKFIGIFSIKVQDKIYTVMDFHSQQLKTIQASKKPIFSGSENYKPSEKKPQQQQKYSNNHSNKNNFNDFNSQFAKIKIHENSNNLTSKNINQKYVVSKSTSTKTSSINGKTKTIKTVKIKYSDGSTQQTVQQTQN